MSRIAQRKRAWLGAGLALCILGIGCRQPEPWNVMLITFDTTRADRLGAYGRANAHTPNLDRLARQGVVFEQARSPAALTLVSHSTIFTGNYPNVHGVRDNGLFVLQDEQDTLAEILREGGYRTAAGIGSFVLDRRWGLAQGFDQYDDHLEEGGRDFQGGYFDERPAAVTVRRWLRWLREEPSAEGAGRRYEPFFSWLHFWEPHHPHLPAHPYAQELANDPYQAEIATADAALGRLLEELELEGLLERTLFIVTADHGEGLGEHGEETHSFLCHDATLRVPLIIRFPQQRFAGSRVSASVGSVDLAPTVLDVLGLPARGTMQGRSLMPLVEERHGRESYPYYAEALSPRTSHGLGELRMWVQDGFKYVHGPRPQLFDLKNDPDELVDLINDRTDVAQQHRDQLERFLAASSRSGAVTPVGDLDEGTRQRLAALGYVSKQGDTRLRDELRSDGLAPRDWVETINRWSRLRQLVRRGKFPQAILLGEELVSEFPGEGFFQMLLAEAYVATGQASRAVEMIAQGSPEARGGPALLRVAARIAAAGEVRLASQTLRTSLESAPSPRGYALYADLMQLQGEIAEAEDALRAALALDAKDTAVAIQLGALLAEHGDRAEASRWLQEAVLRSPLSTVAHFNLGLFLLREGHLEEATASLKRARDLRPDYCRVHQALLEVHARELALVELSEDLGRMELECPDGEALRAARQFVDDLGFLDLPTLEDAGAEPDALVAPSSEG